MRASQGQDFIDRRHRSVATVTTYSTCSGKGCEAETTTQGQEGHGQSTGPQAGSHLYRVTSDPQQLRYSFHHKTQEYCDKHSENQLACIFSHAFSIDNIFNVLKARTTKQVIKLANFSFLKHGFTVMKSTCFPPRTV